MKEIGRFTQEGFESIAIEDDDGKCHMIADFDVDVDGSLPNIYHDPYYQNDTTLHYQGKALNTDEDKFAVLPTPLIKAVKGIVLGCQGRATNLLNGKKSDFVVGDVGPTKKNGEGSRALAIVLEINPNPNTGGMDEAHVLYEWWPGKAAIVDLKQYALQKLL
jgi:hypothetical protein